MTTCPDLLACCGDPVTTADIGFLVQQSPVSRPWMYRRPLFYLWPHSVGITVPKEMEGNTGQKTATPSSVFVMVHSGPDPLPAPNIILLQQARLVQKKPWRRLLFSWLFLWIIRSPETGADSSWADTQRSRTKFLSYVIAYGTFSHATGLDSQSKDPAPPRESNHCCPNMSTPEFICIG